MAAPALNTNLDPKIAARITELQHDKSLAIEREDYDEAKQIKQAVEGLKVIGEKLAQLEERKRAAVVREDYDMAKALKEEIRNLHSVADAANPVAVLTSIPLSQLDEHPVGRAVPFGKALTVPEHCQAFVQDLNSGDARKEPVILPSSQIQTGASGDRLIRSGLDMSLAPPPSALNPNAVSTAPLSSRKRKASHASLMACAPRIKRSCTENWDQKGASGGNIAGCPDANVKCHGSSLAIGGSTEQDRTLGKSAWSSLVNARTPGDGSPCVGRFATTADTPTPLLVLNPLRDILRARQEGNAGDNARRALLAPPSSHVSQQETGSSSSADSTLISGAASSSCCPSSWCPSSSKDLSSAEEHESTFKPAPLPRVHSSKRRCNGQAGHGRGKVAVKRKAGAKGSHSVACKVLRRSKDQKVTSKQWVLACSSRGNATRGGSPDAHRLKRMGVANKTRVGRSGYRGVYISPYGKYRAELKLKGKAKHLGMFVDLEEAARAYDTAAIAEHGPDAIVNFPRACNLSPTFTRRHDESHLVTAGEGCGRGPAATNGSLPAGNAGSNRAPVRTAVRVKGHSPRVMLKRRPPSSGYWGVYVSPHGHGRYRAEIRVQGKGKHLGTFNDAESAARAYDDAAAKFRGSDAVLNFARRSNPRPTLTSTQDPPRVMPAARGHGEQEPADSGLLPATNAGSNLAAVRGVKNSVKHGPGAKVKLEHVNIIMPDGRVRVLARLLDSEKKAWFLLREATNLLDRHAANRDRLLQQSRRLGVLIRPATDQETDIIREAKVVHVNQNKPRLVAPAGLRKTLESLNFPLHTLDSICKEPTQVVGDRLRTGPMQPLLLLKGCLWAAVLSSYNSCNRGYRPNLGDGLTVSLILYAGAVACNAPRGVATPGVGRRPGAQLMKPKPPQSICGFYGVTPHGGGYKAQIHYQGKNFYLGYFKDPVTAARSYDAKATELRGAAAVLNFPPGQQTQPNQ